MDARKLSDDFSVSPQLEIADLGAIAAAGYKSIMCNRPDHEEAGQPDYEAVAAAAADAGLQIVWVPISGGMFTPEAVDEVRAAMADMPGPMLAYCRTGTRCTMLWAITQHGTMDDAEIAERAAHAGYDVSGLLQQLSRG